VSRLRNPFLRGLTIIIGLGVAAWGGVISYRTLFLEPKATAVINETTGAVKEYPNLLRLAGGLILLGGGACTAFFAARRRPL
jgi:hypothetical protein